MGERDHPHRINPDAPNALPPELAEFLRGQHYAALLHPTDHGTALVVKAPRQEIQSVQGQVPIAFNHQLYSHPASPVIRIVTMVYDQPSRPLALETFVNVGDPEQRNDYDALTRQDQLFIFFYDEQLRHRLTKGTRGTDRVAVMRVLTTADRLLAAIPEDQRNFDLAKADVLAQTNL